MRSNSDHVTKTSGNGATDSFDDKESLSSPILMENNKLNNVQIDNNNNNNNDNNLSPTQLASINNGTLTLHASHSFIYDETNDEKIQKTTQYKEDIRQLEDQLNNQHQQLTNRKTTMEKMAVMRLMLSTLKTNKKRKT